MIYLIETDTPPIELPNEVTVTGKLVGVQTQGQLNALLTNAQAFDEVIASGLLDMNAVRQVKKDLDGH